MLNFNIPESYEYDNLFRSIAIIFFFLDNGLKSSLTSSAKNYISKIILLRKSFMNI